MGLRSGTRSVVAVLGATGLLLAAGVASSGGPRGDAWPGVVRLDLELDLSRPPELSAKATLELAGIEGTTVRLLLNEWLAITSARLADGTVLTWKKERRHGWRYHREGRIRRIELPSPPPGGRATLHLEYGGRGADGSGTRDWRGILLLSADEMRMSEQTVFYPQVPAETDGPGVVRMPARVRVLAPEGFEVFVAGRWFDAGDAPAGARAWGFELERPSVLSVVAAPYVALRYALSRDERVIVLLRPEHRELAEGIQRVAREALYYYESRFGRIDERFLGIAEIRGLGRNSYNWASQGLITFDHALLNGGVPTEEIGHEVAHLWWGQVVAAHGEGERFLTEGLAEYSAWRFVQKTDGRLAARARARDARRGYLEAVHTAGADPPLRDVGFRTEAYRELAYAKGALVLRGLEAEVGRTDLDAALAEYRARFTDSSPSLDDFLDAVPAATSARALELAGHAHLELEGVAYDAERGVVTGTIVAAPCPAGIDALLPASVPLVVVGEPEIEIEVALPEGTATFAVAVQSEPAAVVLDPDVTLLAPDASFSWRAARLVGSVPGDGETVGGLMPVDLGYGPEGEAPGGIGLFFDRPMTPLDAGACRGLRRAITEAASAEGAERIKVRSERYIPNSGRHHDVNPSFVGIEADPLFPGESYVLPLDTLVDAYGLAVEPRTIRFTTAPVDDDEPPTIAATAPANGSTDVGPGTDEIRITFSERMRPGWGIWTESIEEVRQAGHTYPALGGSTWEEDGTVLVHRLREPLEPGTTYAIPYRGSFHDWAGNELVAFDLVFTTASR